MRHAVTHADIRELVARTEGPVLLPGREGYDEERTGFNLAGSHRPDVVVGATGAEDVRAAVEFAARHGLPVAVQNAGHGLAAATEGGLLVSTRRMTDVRIDPRTRTASLGAGVRLDRVITVAAEHGLAPLNGSAPHVGAVPYVLGGGMSLLARSHGPAADRVRALEVVTADGRLRHVTPENDPEPYRALLGGRDTVGIVTRLETELVPVARLYGGGLLFDAARDPDTMEVYRRWTRTVPETMNSSLALVPMPDVPDVPEPLRGRYVYHVRIAHTGPAGEGERLVEPLRAAGTPLVDTVREMPYADCAAIHDDPSTPMPWTGDNALLRGADAETVRAVLSHAGPDAAPFPVIVELRHLGGAWARRPKHPNAVGHRDAEYVLAAVVPLARISDEDARPFLKRLFGALEPWGVGRFPNFLGYGAATGPEEVRSAYDPGEFERLSAVKAALDPEELFRPNHTVRPVP